MDVYFCSWSSVYQVNSGVSLGSSHLSSLIGYQILCSFSRLDTSFPLRCAQDSSGSPVPLIGKNRRKEKLPLQSLCTKSSTVVVVGLLGYRI